MNEVILRAYGALNDFLAPERKQSAFAVRFEGRRSVKDAIESVGVPHPEVELIVRNGEPVPFDAVLERGDRIAVFPKFYMIDICVVPHVQSIRPDSIRFALDGHLGKLVRRLRLFGFDATCPAGADDQELVTMAAREDRIVLTRDRDLLKRRAVTHGYFVRNTQPTSQLVEVLQRYGGDAAEPFSRCLRCNGELRAVPKAMVEARLPTRTREGYDDFWICDTCGHVYWRGSHWSRLRRLVDAAAAQSGIQRPRLFLD